MREYFVGACLACVLLLGGASAADTPVSAPTVNNGITRAELTKVLTSLGMTVQDATQQENDAWLKARAPKGIEFAVNFYDCTGEGAANRRCNDLQFLAQWELSKLTTPNAANLYNQKFVFGRAYLSQDGKTFMFDYSVKLKDGVTSANLKRHVDNWLRVLDDLRAIIKV